MKQSVLLIVALWLTLLALPGSAGASQTAVPWSSLGHEEQRLLHSLSDKWDSLTPERQQRLLKGARRWRDLDADQRKRVSKKLRRWKQMDPEQRRELRRRHKEFRNLSPEQRQRIRNKRKWFRQLPEHERKALRKRWQQHQRRGGYDSYPGRQSHDGPHHDRNRANTHRQQKFQAGNLPARKKPAPERHRQQHRQAPHFQAGPQ